MLIPSNQLPKTRSKESHDPCHFIKNINSPYFLVAPKIFWGARPRSNPWTSFSLLLNSSIDAFLQDFVFANDSKIYQTIFLSNQSDLRQVLQLQRAWSELGRITNSTCQLSKLSKSIICTYSTLKHTKSGFRN